VAAVRSLDSQSDDVLVALARWAPADERAVAMAIVGLLPLLLARCGRSRLPVDDLIGELAIVIGDVAMGRSRPVDRQVANRLLDRASARLHRSTLRSTRRLVLCDPLLLGRRLTERDPDPADVVAERVDLARAVRWVSSADARRPTVRAWNAAVALSGVEVRTPSVRRRLKYARRMLRRSRVAELVA
jgi:hypothetical protein